MEKSVKHLFKATMKKLSQEWVKYQKRRIYKQMVSGVKLNKLSKEEKEEIRSYYEKHLGNGPAEYVSFSGFQGRIGFISAVSHKFCDSCNRIRLTAEGYLKLCLQYESGIDLRKLLRSGATDEELKEAMRQAIANLSVKPELLLNDAVMIPGVDIKQVPIIKGDAKSISIGAASIMAKVYRDHMMEEYDKVFPGYDFASNKGYGSKEHIEALHRLGPCPIHRCSFLKNIL